ncbi:MAG: hemerythrin family protein [Bacteriovoracaceae bacterium]|nr:hemerythrin family protein [Bacteriovoracaceae bacterium]
MGYIEWSSYLELGIKDVDDQHHKLIDIINKLYDGLFEEHTKEIQLEVLSGLLKYTEEHFKDEEELLRVHNFIDNEEHIKKHKEFTDKIIYYHESITAGKMVMSLDILSYLTEWLTGHIQGIDKEYVAFLKNKGVV